MYCPNCGKDAGESKFCPECGKTLSAEVTPEDTVQSIKGKPKKKKKVLFAILGIAILIVVVILLPKLFKSDSASSHKAPAEEISFNSMLNTYKTNSIAGDQQYKGNKYSLYFKIESIEDWNGKAKCNGYLYDSNYREWPWYDTSTYYSYIDVYFSKEVAAQLVKGTYYIIEGEFDGSFDDDRDEFTFPKIQKTEIVGVMDPAEIPKLKTLSRR